MKVKFFIECINSNKVHAIKAIRSATGLGLKESKDFIDNMYHIRKHVIMSDAQFGRLMIELMSNENPPLQVREVQKFDMENLHDFSILLPM